MDNQFIFECAIISTGIFLVWLACHMARIRGLARELKQELSTRVVAPLFERNHLVLPPGTRVEDVVEAFAPGDNTQFLATVFHDLVERGELSPYYLDLAEIVLKNYF